MPEKICSPSNTARVKIINLSNKMIVKRIDTILPLAALLAAALVSCSKTETEEPRIPVTEEGFAVTLVASGDTDNDTRTELRDDRTIWWTVGKEQVRFMETVAGTTVHQTSGFGRTDDDGRTMTFQVWMEQNAQPEAGPYVYQTVYPHLACADKSYAGDYPVKVLAVQKPTATSFDPTADLLVGKPIVMDRRITSGQDPKISLRFHRMIAVGKMTIKGLQSSDPVTSVQFSAPGKVLAGTCRLNLLENTVLEYGSAEPSESVTLDYASLGLRADEQMPVYFTCLPCELTAGDRFVVTVKTARQQFSKTVTIPEGRPIAFQEGGLSLFSVDMSQCAEEMPDADAIALSGTATADLALNATLENERVFAGQLELSAGKLRIEASFGGEKRYLRPALGAVETDGAVVRAVVTAEPYEWTIPAAARYRVVVDGSTANRSVAIYSPERDLQPLSVTFRPNGAETNPETTITVTDLWAYGGGTGWGVRRLNVTASAADPQVLIYTGSFNGGVKFCIAQNFTVEGTSYNQNNAYCFTNPLTAEGKRQNLTLASNKLGQLHGGADGETRNSYYGMPSGTHTYIFDLRNMTILAKSVQ